MEICIRPFESKDVEAVSALDEACFSRPWSTSDYENLLGKEQYHYLVAEYDGKVVGFLGMMIVCGEGNIDRVMVDSTYRNRKIAGKLLGQLLEDGENAGICAYTLEVRVSNEAAIHLYEKYGFVSEGIRPGFYDRPVEDAMIMWRR